MLRLVLSLLLLVGSLITFTTSKVEATHIHSGSHPNESKNSEYQIRNDIKPALHLTSSRVGLDNALKWLVPRASYILGLIDIPDYRDSLNIPIIGDVQLDVTSMNVQQISVNSLTFENDQTSQSSFFLKLKGLRLRMNDKWHYRQNNFPHFEGHGTSVVNVAGAAVNGRIKMLVNEEGKSYLWISSPDDLDVDIGDLDISIDGGISGDITNILMKIFGKVLKPVITNAIRNAIIKEVNVMLKEMTESLPFMIPVPIGDNQMCFDVSSTENPMFQDDYASFPILGDWSIKGREKPDSPIEPGKIPDSPMHDSMLNLFVSQAALDNFFWTAMEGKIFQVRITNDMVPPESPYHLRTDSLKYIFPELYKQYNNSELVLDVEMAQIPKLSMAHESGFSATTNMTLTFQVVLEDEKSLKPAFSLNTIISARAPVLGLVNTNEGKSINVTGSIDSADIRISLKDSWIGNIDVGYIQTQAKIIIIFGYLPTLQQQLKEGITFDLPQVLFGQLFMSETLFSFEDGYIDFSTSFEIVPNPSDSHPHLHLGTEANMLQISELDILKERVKELKRQLEKMSQKLSAHQTALGIKPNSNK